MAALTEARVVELLRPVVAADECLREQLGALAPKFIAYLELLLRWNARTNLTSVRAPEEIVSRHFGESVFAASMLRSRVSPDGTLLDLGSGAGFPGLPIQICLPELQVTLAESQGKKASFLREAVRTLELGCEIWAARAEALPVTRRFDVVTLRAVDRMDTALVAAGDRVAEGGVMLLLAGHGLQPHTGWATVDRRVIPDSRQRFVSLHRKDGTQVFHVEHS